MNTTIRNLARGGAAVIAAGAVTFGGLGVASAGPSQKPVHGKEYLTVNQINDKGVVILHGLFTAYGSDVSGEESDLLKLNGGTLTIYHPEADGTYSYQIDPLTCFTTSTVSGKYTLGAGTGKYAGVTGGGTYKGSFQAVAKRAKDGSCDTENDPSLGFGTISANGPVTLGVTGGSA